MTVRWRIPFFVQTVQLHCNSRSRSTCARKRTRPQWQPPSRVSSIVRTPRSGCGPNLASRDSAAATRIGLTCPLQVTLLAPAVLSSEVRRAKTEKIMPASYETHRAQLKAILSAWGMTEENAETTADVLSWADLHGVDSHGMSMIPGYDRLRRDGRANMKAQPRIIKQTPVSALVDGDGGLGHVPARFAMQVAIDKAKVVGIAIAAVRN